MISRKSLRLAPVVLLCGFCALLTTARAVKKSQVEAESGVWTPTIIDGDPALQYLADGWSSYIAVTRYNGTLAFKLQSERFGGGEGYLYISSKAVAWDPVLASKKDEIAFSYSLLNVKIAPVPARHSRIDAGCGFTATGRDIQFYPVLRKREKSLDPVIEGFYQAYVHWCTTSAADFPAALEAFKGAVGSAVWESSSIGKEERQVFDQQVAAWRAAGSKVDPPEEAQRHFAIAQEAFAEKNFEHQAEELEAALQVYPTWPAEQSDLAVILGELNRYSGAIEHMQMYLDLVPDAPDAQKAKQQIWIWQDKVAQNQSAAPTAETQPTHEVRK
jgi:hypothetical protein